MKKTQIYIPVLLFFSFFLIYLISVYPAFNNNDSPETIAAAKTLGIGHPPGYPLYTMLGKVFTLMNIGGAGINLNIMAAFLAALAVLAAYFTFLLLFPQAGALPAAFSASALALAPAFFWEALDAKGGIYHFNLLFLAVLLVLSAGFMKKFRARDFYLLSFTAGLCLAHHWQSMVIIAPAVLVLALVAGGKESLKRLPAAVFFILLGLSAYIYLPIRAHTALLNHGDPRDLAGFIAHVFRLNYRGESLPLSFSMLGFQGAQALGAVFLGYLALCAPAAVGVFRIFSRDKKTGALLLFVMAINIILVVFFFRRRQESSCYYLPSVFIMSLFIGAGFEWLMENRNRMTAAAVTGLLFLCLLTGPILNGLQARAKNYLSYDYGKNIVKTVDSGLDAAYFTASDFDAMPLTYFEVVDGWRGRLIVSQTLAFAWGIKQNAIQYGDAGMTPGKPGANVKKLIGWMNTQPLEFYGGFSADDAEKMGIPHAQAGITLKVSKNLQPDFFRIYSYRGVYNEGYRKYDDNFALISNYSGALSNYGVELYRAGRKNAAISAFKRALALPYNGSREGMVHNLSLAEKL